MNVEQIKQEIKEMKSKALRNKLVEEGKGYNNGAYLALEILEKKINGTK